MDSVVGGIKSEEEKKKKRSWSRQTSNTQTARIPSEEAWTTRR